jgi:tRNA-binding protein
MMLIGKGYRYAPKIMDNFQQQKMKPETTIDVFQQLDIRVGVILKAEPFPEARKPALKLWIDFGNLGILQSSAQITQRYQPAEITGKQVVAIVNFPPRRVAGFKSECLVLGASNHQGDVVLIQPDMHVEPGWEIA